MALSSKMVARQSSDREEEGRDWGRGIMAGTWFG
jgi:hypothetical protein